MAIMDVLKKIFPKPNIPQKRYIILLVGIGYAAAKLYVTATPSPLDDILLERVHEVAMQLLADGNESAGHAKNELLKDVQTYGETS
jgi:hypothetical protein